MTMSDERENQNEKRSISRVFSPFNKTSRKQTQATVTPIISNYMKATKASKQKSTNLAMSVGKNRPNNS